MTVHLCRNPAYLLHFCSISRGTARGFPDQRGFLLQPAGTPPYSPTGHGPTAESFSLDCYLGLAPPCCCFLWEIPLTCSKQQRITQQIQWNLTWNVRPHHLHIYRTRTVKSWKLCTQTKLLSWFFDSGTPKLYLFNDLEARRIIRNGKFSLASVLYRKLQLVRAHFGVKAMHLAVECNTQKRKQRTLTPPSQSSPPPGNPCSHSKLISIPLSWVHRWISTQTTCHEQSQSEKQSSYGFLWLLYDLIIVGFVCTLCCLS